MILFLLLAFQIGQILLIFSQGGRGLLVVGWGADGGMGDVWSSVADYLLRGGWSPMGGGCGIDCSLSLLSVHLFIADGS